MRKNLVIGILEELKNKWERRAPLAPEQVRWLVKRQIHVEVISSGNRIFTDTQYRRAGAAVLKEFRKANLIIGIKEPRPQDLKPGTVYMIFSHTTKGQIQNRPLLKSFLNKRITLVDFEHITDRFGERLAYFGRFAGICGMIDSLHCAGQRYRSRGLATPFEFMKPARTYKSYEEAKSHLRELSKQCAGKGVPASLAPFIIGIVGHGNVSRGAQEVLEIFKAEDIHPTDIGLLISNRRRSLNNIYKIVFDREEKLRSKDGKGFYFETYLKHPDLFESNMDRYLPHLNILMNTAYWDKRFPRLVTKKMIQKLYTRKPFRLDFIGDLSCDVKGSIEMTVKTTEPDKPTYVYDPIQGRCLDAALHPGIAILAVDNLPCEMPAESSSEFGELIQDYVYQIASHGVQDLTKHHALSREIRGAVVTERGRLAPGFQYLKKYC